MHKSVQIYLHFVEQKIYLIPDYKKKKKLDILNQKKFLHRQLLGS